MDKQIKNAIENGKSFKKKKAEFFMNRLGENRGITLIALIVTIIVLLLLAGVTIATLTGDNGILSQAQNASEVSDVAEVEELLQLEYANLVGAFKLKCIKSKGKITNLLWFFFF